MGTVYLGPFMRIKGISFTSGIIQFLQVTSPPYSKRMLDDNKFVGFARVIIEGFTPDMIAAGVVADLRTVTYSDFRSMPPDGVAASASLRECAVIDEPYRPTPGTAVFSGCGEYEYSYSTLPPASSWQMRHEFGEYIDYPGWVTEDNVLPKWKPWWCFGGGEFQFRNYYTGEIGYHPGIWAEIRPLIDKPYFDVWASATTEMAPGQYRITGAQSNRQTLGYVNDGKCKLISRTLTPQDDQWIEGEGVVFERIS